MVFGVKTVGRVVQSLRKPVATPAQLLEPPVPPTMLNEGAFFLGSLLLGVMLVLSLLVVRARRHAAVKAARAAEEAAAILVSKEVVRTVVNTVLAEAEAQELVDEVLGSALGEATKNDKPKKPNPLDALQDILSQAVTKLNDAMGAESSPSGKKKGPLGAWHDLIDNILPKKEKVA